MTASEPDGIVEWAGRMSVVLGDRQLYQHQRVEVTPLGDEHFPNTPGDFVVADVAYVCHDGRVGVRFLPLPLGGPGIDRQAVVARGDLATLIENGVVKPCSHDGLPEWGY